MDRCEESTTTDFGVSEQLALFPLPPKVGSIGDSLSTFSSSFSSDISDSLTQESDLPDFSESDISDFPDSLWMGSCAGSRRTSRVDAACSEELPVRPGNPVAAVLDRTSEQSAISSEVRSATRADTTEAETDGYSAQFSSTMSGERQASFELDQSSDDNSALASILAGRVVEAHWRTRISKVPRYEEIHVRRVRRRCFHAECPPLEVVPPLVPSGEMTVHSDLFDGSSWLGSGQPPEPQENDLIHGSTDMDFSLLSRKQLHDLVHGSARTESSQLQESEMDFSLLTRSQLCDLRYGSTESDFSQLQKSELCDLVDMVAALEFSAIAIPQLMQIRC